MKTERIIVANLKCNGCASTIKKELQKIEGVQQADVNLEEDKVMVSFEGNLHNSIVEKLLALGYPEATEKNGLLLQLKSYTSCMIGRINNL